MWALGAPGHTSTTLLSGGTSMKLVATLIAFAMLAACSGETIETEELINTRTYSYKSIAGVSMGGGAAAYLAFS